MKSTTCIALTMLAMLLFANALWAQNPAVGERMVALKRTLLADRAKLKQYEWIETTVVNAKGKEASRTQNRCYWGAEGKLQKVPVVPPKEEKKKRGLRGRIAARKKEEMTEYMKNAVGMVKLYVPPDPNRLQVLKDAGKVSLDITKPGKRVRLNFHDYRRPGDTLGIEIDLTKNTLLGAKIATYVADPKDKVTLTVKFASLLDGTGYPAKTTFDAKAKEIRVTVENSGYRKAKQEQESQQTPPSGS